MNLHAIGLTIFLFAVTGSSLQQTGNNEVPQSASAEDKQVFVGNPMVFAVSKGSKNGRTEIAQFVESADFKLRPAAIFQISVDVKNTHEMPDDFIAWTSLDFFIAPPARSFVSGKLDPLAWASWGQDTLIKDFRTSPVYWLRGGESRRVAFAPYDLNPLLNSFQDNPKSLWVWALRINVSVMNREGKQVGSTQRIIRLTPTASRTSEFDPTVPVGEPVRAVPLSH